MDKAISFFFKDIPVRGHVCRLNESISDSLVNHSYPTFINELIAEMAASIQCFMMDIKKEDCHGTLQITGSGPAKLALVDVHSQNSYRACATFKDLEALKGITSIHGVFGDSAQLSMTIDIKDNRYQTILPIIGDTLESSLQNYFIQSQQIPTILLSKSSSLDTQTQGGVLILQKMPGAEGDEKFDAIWHELAVLTSTLKTHELLGSNKSLEDLLYLLYHEHDPIVSRETFPKFVCTCSQAKFEKLVKELANDETGNLEIICEYCGKIYLIKTDA